MIELLGSPKRPADGAPCRNGMIQAATGVMIRFPREYYLRPFSLPNLSWWSIIYIYIFMYKLYPPCGYGSKLTLPSRRIGVRWTKRNRHVMLGLLRWIPISSQPTQPFRFPRDISGPFSILLVWVRTLVIIIIMFFQARSQLQSLN